MHRSSPASAPGRWPRSPHDPAPSRTAPRPPSGAGPALALLAGLALGGCGTARMPQGEERADLQRPQMRMAGPASALAGEADATPSTSSTTEADDGPARGLIAISVSGERETQDTDAEGGANGLGSLMRAASTGRGGSASGSGGSTGSTGSTTATETGGVIERVRTRTPAVYLRLPLGRLWTFEAAGSAQRRTGVTPTWYTDTDSLRSVDERRRTADARLTRRGSHHALSLGVHGAQDDDSRARGLSLQGHWDSQDHHSRFHLGLAWTGEEGLPDSASADDGSLRQQRAGRVQLGLTQTLGRHDVVQLEWTGSLQRGDLDDPDLAYDVRPGRRQAQALWLRWNHWLGFAALRTGWRLYGDDWGVRAHTLEAAMAFPMGADNRSTVTPEVRWTTQSAARFYVPWNGASVIYPVPTRHWNGYTTLDPRLAAWGALGMAIKVDAALDADWNASLKLGVQRQQARWRLLDEGSGGLAPLTTWSWQAGLRRAF